MIKIIKNKIKVIALKRERKSLEAFCNIFDNLKKFGANITPEGVIVEAENRAKLCRINEEIKVLSN